MTFFKAVFYFIILILPTQFLSASTQVDILYSSDADIAGFQFNVDNVDLISASGGDAETAGFTVSTGNNTVLGFSFSGLVIPAGSGILTTLEVEFVRLEGHSILVIDLFACVDTKVYFLSPSIFLVEVVDIVGCDDRYPQPLCQFRSSFEDSFLFRETVILHFHEKSTWSEDVDVSTGTLFCFFRFTVEQSAIYFSRETS